jgi:hypothetical protein
MDEINKLIIVDKCVDGDMTKLKEVVDDFYDEVDQLYELLKPLMVDRTLETIQYTHKTEGIRFSVKTSKDMPAKFSKSSTAKIITSVEGGIGIINIPITKEG